MTAATDSTPLGGERAILVHQHSGRLQDRECPEELSLLAVSAGAEVCACLTGYRPTPDPATYIGKGKVQELKELAHIHHAELVVVNHAISPVQERNLARAAECRVVDRTGLILDIFAQRAATAEGKLQVELAQLRHLSTRLVRGWTHLERQKGGIGLRGPGEKQLETDRRLINRRIKYLTRRLERVVSQRALRRKSRRKVPIPTVCLVGYTNAGKSSLFNRLTGAEVLAEDRLFATLDPTMRRLHIDDHGELVLSDTVGFIRDLPHSLIKAFHATLEEVSNANLLLHVVDVNDQERRTHMEQVEQVLAEINAASVPSITVYNKIDLTDRAPRIERNRYGRVHQVWLSAVSGAGVDGLLSAIAERLGEQREWIQIRLPVSAPQLRASIYQQAVVLKETTDNNGDCILEVEISDTTLGRLRRHPDFDACIIQPLYPLAAVGVS